MAHMNLHTKKRTTAEVGKAVSIPGHAAAITVSDLSPFGNTVQVSWLEPDNEQPKITNEYTIYADRQDFANPKPVDIPNRAVGTTIWEPPDSANSIVYWLY
ncbi:hypothetical protein HRTV-25_gp85 [Halorubrum tailed virus 25]|uniref:Uncharacterized protein n=1 Tax=Halorubrum tailed virus 25 TaxID=2878006 RepID=A0AAE8XYC6_9CAUD|nr:hypothetical protein M1M37_gp085 [Halorubrum tailed virus 25]UBF22666.1 hypothetical protein HRTV-25_gp85 [Halorubrum tailed virus 25]